MLPVLILTLALKTGFKRSRRQCIFEDHLTSEAGGKHNWWLSSLSVLPVMESIIGDLVTFHSGGLLMMACRESVDGSTGARARVR